MKRLEQCKIVLQGNSSFEARDVYLEGNLEFVVPDGYKMTVGQDGSTRLEPIGSDCIWAYQLVDNEVVLTQQRQTAV